MLSLVEDQQHLTFTEVKSQIAEDPVNGSHRDGPAALGHSFHQVKGADALSDVDVISSAAVQRLVKVFPQQADVFRLIELSGADDRRRNRMSGNEVTNRCSNQA